jgi:hypothetical protein
MPLRRPWLSLEKPRFSSTENFCSRVCIANVESAMTRLDSSVLTRLRQVVLIVAIAVWPALGSSVRGSEIAFQPPPDNGDATLPRVEPPSDPLSDPSLSDPSLSDPSLSDPSLSDLDRDGTDPLGGSRFRYQRLSFNGYGEIHANVVEGPGRDEIDLHRLVIGTQYDFTSWLYFVSELEVEHALVGEEGGGLLLFEQAFIEYQVNDYLRVRAGRMLVPVGIVNQKHEPPSFNGVERPSFNRYIVPSTWFAEGFGVRGFLGPVFMYQAYWMTGLDGSGFSALNGIRGGRIEERSSLNQPAFSGRLDCFPFAVAASPGQQALRFGVSTFLGGLNNGNAGRNPGVNGSVSLISADFEYRIGRWDFRGEFAHEEVPAAQELGNGIAEGILGGYLESALHVLPDQWRCGRLATADALIFVRYDDFNTQYRMPAGVPKNNAGDRDEWTVGAGFFPVPNFVVKVDYQIPHDATGKDLPERFNVGLGWQY